MNSEFPELVDLALIGHAIDSSFNQFVSNHGEGLEATALPLLKLLNLFESGLLATPWWLVIIALGALGGLIARSAKVALVVVVLMFGVGLVGVWVPAMATIALMLVATLLSVLIGIPIGLMMSQWRVLRTVLLPVLDVMQTLPIFVYLIPFVMLFGPGKIPALLATIFFAVSPVIRLTDLGVRQVDGELVEAVRAFGTTKTQILFTVQMPLALPSIMAGINQTTMMALSMVVIASMIGAGGLGYQVLQGIQRLDVSRGLLAGTGIVLLAIVFDRIAQAYGKRAQKTLKLG
ncbi:glycine/betaine ABC transporter permease [Pandoraea terrae]|uniref:Glycine/betaine ABC transporter permease n=1 Tax=Pandoraea terrae TaxID=1537710 RepID=A0A5E4VX38_9BURK|nr:ABC transporter permease subunit [Pandoraea terrae]VVE17167.1 glycine/betaine ABC transporter permease [Pandoraea terrae]